MASSSGMKASSSRSIYTCANEFCGRIMDRPLPGWKSGDRLVDLCNQCFVAFCYNQFCSVYHKTLKGWKTCRSCQKDFHCGCVASSSLYDEKDSEFECQGCVAKHANLNQTLHDHDTTITPTLRANGDTITSAPRDIDDTTVTSIPHVNGDTITITLTPRAIDDTTVTPTPRVIHETTITPTPCANDDTIITHTARANHDATITPTPRALKQNASEPSSKTRASSQTREKKCQPGNRRGKSVPYRNAPRMINLQVEEFQRGCVGENSQIVMGFREEDCDRPEVKLLIPLFEKVLTSFDTGRSRCLVLPKKCAKIFFPPINDHETKQIVCHDAKGEDWRFKLRLSPKYKGRMYVLDEFNLYVEAMDLSLGDTVTFSWLDPERKMIIGYRKNSSESSYKHLPRAAIASTSRVRDANEAQKPLSSDHGGNDPVMTVAERVKIKRKKDPKQKLVIRHQNATTAPPLSELAQDKAEGKHTEIGSTSRSAGKKRKISAFDPALQESTEEEWSPFAPRSSKGKAIVTSSTRPPKKVPSKDEPVAKKIKNINLGRISESSSKMTKTRNCEREQPQATVKVRVPPQQSNVTKKHARHRTGCQCIICIEPPSGSKHSLTCSSLACVAKRLRVNMAEKASQEPPIRRKREVPETTEPSNQQVIRASHGSEENEVERREPSPSAEPSNQQTFKIRGGSEENQNERTEPSQIAEPSNHHAITVNRDSEEGSHSNNSIRLLFDLNLPASDDSIRPLFDLNFPASDDDDDFVDPTHQYTNGYGGYIRE